MHLRNVATIVASFVTAIGAATLVTTDSMEARQNPPFACEQVTQPGGLPGIGCVSGGTNCWLGGLGPHPDTGEYGCWTEIMSSTDCCKTIYVE